MDTSIHAFIEYGWTLASLFAVLLCIFTLPRARRVYRDVKADEKAMREAGEVNGRRAFAAQQTREGKLLLRAHWFAFVHQSMFFAVGVYALFEPNPKMAPATPLLEELGVPLTLLLAQYLIVLLQISLYRITSEQAAWRVESLGRRHT